MKQKILSVITILAVLLTTTIPSVMLQGCGKKEQGATELKVYYVKSYTNDYESVLNFYNQNNTDVVLNCTVFETQEELTERVAAEFATGTGPDIVLLTDAATVDVYKAVKSGNIADLSNYLEADEDIGEDKYYTNIIDGIKIDGKTYVLPFSFGLNVYGSPLQTEPKEAASKDMSYSQFLDMLVDVQRTMQEEYPEDFSFWIEGNEWVSMVTVMIRALGLELTDEKSQLAVSKEDFRKVFEILKGLEEEFQEKTSLFMEGGVGRYGKIQTFLISGNMPQIFSKIDMGVGAVKEDTLTFHAVPNPTNDNGTGAVVDSYGFVNNGSKEIEKCYRVLKFIMDYYSGNYLEYALTVNKKTCQEVLTRYAEGKQEDWLNESEMLTSRRWSIEEIDAVKDMISRITVTVLPNTTMETMMSEGMEAYMTSSKDFDTCYEQMLNRIELYLNE